MTTSLQSLRATIRPTLIVIGAFSFIINALALVSSIYMMQVFDRVMPNGSMPTLGWLTLIAVAACGFIGLLDAIRASTVTRLGAWIEARIAPVLIAAGIENDRPTAKPVEALMKVRYFLGGPSVYPLLDAPWMPFFIAVLWIMHPWYGLLAIGSSLILFALAVATEIATRRSGEEAARLFARGRSVVEGAVRNADTARAMAMSENVSRHWESANTPALARQIFASDVSSWLGGAAKSIRLAIQIAVLGLGVLLAVEGEVSGGTIIAASILLAKALAPVEQAIAGWKSFVSAREGWRSVKDALAAGHDRELTRLPAPQGRVEAEGVSWRPTGAAEDILKPVSIAFRPGTATGIIGVSASGKTTLCRLLAGALRPTGGVLRMDGADYRNWPREQLGGAVGYLAQEIELFPGTVATNIARMAEAPDPAGIIEAARMAGAHDFIMRLPDGYDTVITEDGRSLSGGQRQRIGLARALYGAPKLIVLDEPNSNLDEEGDRALLRAIGAAKAGGAAIVVVSHRPSILVGLDRLAVMQDGRLVLEGAPQAVLQRLSMAPRNEANKPVAVDAPRPNPIAAA